MSSATPAVVSKQYLASISIDLFRPGLGQKSPREGTNSWMRGAGLDGWEYLWGEGAHNPPPQKMNSPVTGDHTLSLW